MTAMKTLALGALAATIVAQAATAGAIGGSIRWSSWQAGNDDTGSDPGVNGLFASIATTPIGSGGTMPTANTPVAVDSSTGKWAVVDNTATVAASNAAAASPAPMGTGFTSTAAAPAAPSQPTYDAFINLGNGPYPNAGALTTGGAQPWYDSQPVAALFGGHPNAQQQAAFDQAVLQRVEQTFQNSGVPVSLTADPTASAAHTLSVVSNTTSTWGPVLGLTNVGSNGISFIDQAAKSANSVDQLEWIVAHNVSHELMLAFGVGENYDHTGKYIDAPVANWSMMVDPNASFSKSASQALLATNFQDGADPSNAGAQQISPQPVPEPAAVALWTTLIGGLCMHRARRRKSEVRPMMDDAG